MRRLVLTLSVLLAPQLSAMAQTAGGCSAFKWHVDREEMAFAADSLPTVIGGGQIPGVMEAVTIQLTDQSALTFPVPPTHKPRNTPAYGGIYPIVPIVVPGNYQVTISDGGWIDVVQNGQLLKQTGFTDSKDCHAVRKSVRFAFAKGPATIQISDAAKTAMKIEVLPPPP